MKFLIIDTCTERGVIAYGNQEEILFEKALPFGISQSKFLMPDLSQSLQPFGYPPKINAIGVGVGPGSYTGIRVGVAVAQSLAYCWKVPLIGFSSLISFIPSSSIQSFAAILDARIGGVYLQKGRLCSTNKIEHDLPKVLSVEEAIKNLENVTHLVTPHIKPLQSKLIHPEKNWIWEEKAPSVQILFQNIEDKYTQQQFVIPPQQLDLLYLRQTEAEREKANQKQKAISH